MSAVTRRLAAFANKQVTVDLTYDDVTGVVQQASIVNATSRGLRVEAFKTSGAIFTTVTIVQDQTVIFQTANNIGVGIRPSDGQFRGWPFRLAYPA